METNMNIYQKLYRSIELLNSGEFNGLIVESPSGTGKSFNIDKKLQDMKAKYIVFQGDISEAKFYEFLYEHRKDYIIVFRDLGKLMRNRYFIETLKHITDPIKIRHIRREVYAIHEDIPSEFDFESSIIIELNEIGEKYKADIDAIKSRCLVVKLIISIEDFQKIMLSICHSEGDLIATKYLFEKSCILGKSFNLRLWNMVIRLYNLSIKENITNWKEQIDMFLEVQISEMRKMLYRFAGENPIKRIDFVKYLMIDNGFEYRTAQRKIAEHIEIGEIFTNGLEQDMLISTKPFGELQVISIGVTGV